mmetsp:Transcript_17218/g.20658  ORF Transcript_17218/g.20658 Transcript_17218/m.20658 type:complete len:310 (-) Transcript_17218:220-1149(-)|eukprot:CAMPEP_0195262576 /NCGR_PEP_ID=MMETSP0706-20130129/9830_1 /TAXON_ID=33640 /ORGANISM="Asterionellopsis glacialis, Strain CCMP134" /LENGTH=309 /DNA_ID=CAMNT_0040316669 /DNA_START=47 /DNA_END=976 /DNA_ORIENTATION=+
MAWSPTKPGLGCEQINMAGIHYEEFSCLYQSTIGKLYSSHELNYDPVPVRDWMKDRPIIPIAAIIAYGLFCYFGQAYFKDRKAWSWRTALSFWNLGLSTFSLIGFMRTAPMLLHNLQHWSLEQNICNEPESMYGSGSSGLWVQLFVLSKFPELFDTLFIVIHKKPLIFLHWYHHITVLLYCWHSYVTSAPPGIFFVVMNYGVHAIMYFYYFLMAVKLKPKWMNAMVITVAQISQMVVGVAVTVLGFYYSDKHSKLNDDGCLVKTENNVAAFVMYGSYLFLFLQFFVARYFKANLKNKQRLAPPSKKKEQ